MFMLSEIGSEYDFSLNHILLDLNSSGEKCLTDIIECLTNTYSPNQLKLMVFAKSNCDLGRYANSPYLWCPIITNQRRAVEQMEIAYNEMKQRYSELTRGGTWNIKQYNEIVRKDYPDKLLPELYILISRIEQFMQPNERINWLINEITLKANPFKSGIHIIASTACPPDSINKELLPKHNEMSEGNKDVS